MDRNLILAVVLGMTVLMGWDYLIVKPQRDAYEAFQAEKAAAAEEQRIAAGGEVGGGASVDVSGLGGQADAALITLDEALAKGPGRVAIDTPALKGSINLTGARLDDLSLRNYRETIDEDSPIIRLLSPREADHGHYIQQGWSIDGVVGEAAEWTLTDGSVLTPTTPVTLTREADGLVIKKTISVDEQYMFTITQSVVNNTDDTKMLVPYGLVIQRGVPNDLKNFMILHEGPISIVGKSLYQRKYKKILKKGGIEEKGERGWVGITNKYWLAAAIPPQSETFEAVLDNVGDSANPVFRASYMLDQQPLAPGEEKSIVSYLYGGAKDVDILQGYEAEPAKGGLGVYDFDKSVDWGNFFFLTRPIFYTLNYFGDLLGNFGLSILILTLIIKAILFPLANKAYESMSQMKKVQPEMEKLRKRYEDDKVKLQQEMMELYKREKVNPVAGCLPVIIQMPIFYALYKTLFVTIELRHEPFVGWIRDLSAPDPTTIFNLFGLLPFDPMALPLIGAFLGIGVLPLLMGVAMWFQTKLNPPPADPMQAQIFAMMPIMFTFLFASFASGLVLYWFWNTFLSILQQWMIMKKNGVDTDWGERLPFLKSKKASSGDGS